MATGRKRSATDSRKRRSRRKRRLRFERLETRVALSATSLAAAPVLAEAPLGDATANQDGLTSAMIVQQTSQQALPQAATLLAAGSPVAGFPMVGAPVVRSLSVEAPVAVLRPMRFSDALAATPVLAKAPLADATTNRNGLTSTLAVSQTNQEVLPQVATSPAAESVAAQSPVSQSSVAGFAIAQSPLVIAAPMGFSNSLSLGRETLHSTMLVMAVPTPQVLLADQVVHPSTNLDTLDTASRGLLAMVNRPAASVLDVSPTVVNDGLGENFQHP